MHSNNEAANQTAPQLSFIEAARRAQIVAATIATLAEIGYAKASFVQIAKRAQITPSLISYHFADKDALIAHTLETIASAWDAEVQAQVGMHAGAPDQLRAYIMASVGYMGARPAHFAALIEIVFNARTAEGVLLYRSESEEEPTLTLLKEILLRGQQRGEFRSFAIHAMAVAIRGAINEFFGEMHKPQCSLESYSAELVELFARAVAL
jgi:TetR/AcrR family transcriptional regulator, transcriptional repressor of bet genes